MLSDICKNCLDSFFHPTPLEGEGVLKERVGIIIYNTPFHSPFPISIIFPWYFAIYCSGEKGIKKRKKRTEGDYFAFNNILHKVVCSICLQVKIYNCCKKKVSTSCQVRAAPESWSKYTTVWNKKGILKTRKFKQGSLHSSNYYLIS